MVCVSVYFKWALLFNTGGGGGGGAPLEAQTKEAHGWVGT